MANKIYSLVFTSDDPRNTTALTPTLVVFNRQDTGGVLTAPGITQAIASSGIFQFEYFPTLPIAFIADGGASAPVRYLAGNLDPVQWVDQVATTLAALGVTSVALGTTGVALGTTSVALGTTSVALGVTSVALGTSIVAASSTLTGYGVSIYAGTQTLLAYGNTINAIGSSILGQLGTTASSIGTTNTDPVDIMGHLKRIQEFHEGTSEFSKTSGLWQIKTRGSTLMVQRTLANAVTTVTKT